MKVRANDRRKGRDKKITNENEWGEMEKRNTKKTHVQGREVKKNVGKKEKQWKKNNNIGKNKKKNL